MKGRRKKGTAPLGANLTARAPASLDDHGKQVWKWAIEVCREAGRPLLQMHAEALTGLCHASSDVIAAGEVIRKEGMTINGGREGTKRHPAVSTRLQALQIKRSYLAELGLTPTSASRLPEAPKPGEINPFAGI